MSQFLTKYNSDDVFFRSIIVGLLNFMTNKVRIWNIVDDTLFEYPVPFYYNAGGDQRFMQDIFQQQTLDDCINDKVVEANSDIIPRGHVTLSGVTIQASSLTNRFVRGKHTKETKDEIITYNSPMNIIPLELTFDCEVRIDGKVMAFKLLQRLIQTFYKVSAFEYMWEGMPLKAAIAFPEDNTFENAYEFTFGDPTDSKITFTVLVETYLPVIDKTQTMLQSNRIENWNLQVNTGQIFSPNKDLDGDIITPTEPALNNVVTINDNIIPENISDAERIIYWDELVTDDKSIDIDPGPHVESKITPPGDIPIYSLKDRI